MMYNMYIYFIYIGVVEMKKPVMGIQLYTLRDHIKTAEDFDSTLERLEKAGVRDVQISAIGDIAPEVQREILDKHNMRVCVTHKPLESILGDVDGMIAHHKTIGCDAIGLGWMPENERENREGLIDFIKKLETAAKKYKENGISFNYHNHDFEFKPFDGGENIMDIIFSVSAPELFNFIPDVAWIDYAGFDPCEVLKRMKGRVKVVHFKDYVRDSEGKKHFVPLGEGVVDLKKCYDTVCELEIPYVMYEQDDEWPDGDAFKACGISWEYMKKLQI